MTTLNKKLLVKRIEIKKKRTGKIPVLPYEIDVADFWIC